MTPIGILPLGVISYRTVSGAPSMQQLAGPTDKEDPPKPELVVSGFGEGPPRLMIPGPSSMQCSKVKPRSTPPAHAGHKGTCRAEVNPTRYFLVSVKGRVACSEVVP